MKIKYLSLEDRQNIRVLRHASDDTLKLNILESIMRRPFYTLQALWEYRRWFLELTEEQREFFLNSSAVYGSLWMGHTIVGAKELLAELKAKGVKIMFDAEPNSWKPDWEDYFACASYVSMNEYSAEKFRGNLSMKEFCKKVFALGVEAIILTLGKDGCRLLTREEDIYIPAYDLKVADTTGCGDTFNATFLASVLTGKGLPEAVKYANAAANMAATVLGPRGGITTFEKVEEFLERWD